MKSMLLLHLMTMAALILKWIQIAMATQRILTKPSWKVTSIRRLSLRPRKTSLMCQNREGLQIQRLFALEEVRGKTIRIKLRLLSGMLRKPHLTAMRVSQVSEPWIHPFWTAKILARRSILGKCRMKKPVRGAWLLRVFLLKLGRRLNLDRDLEERG